MIRISRGIIGRDSRGYGRKSDHEKVNLAVFGEDRIELFAVILEYSKSPLVEELRDCPSQRHPNERIA